MLKTSPHHKTCEMINAYLEIKPITGPLLKNYSMATHAFFPLSSNPVEAHQENQKILIHKVKENQRKQHWKHILPNIAEAKRQIVIDLLEQKKFPPNLQRTTSPRNW